LNLSNDLRASAARLGKPALLTGDGAVTYSDLDARVDRVAALLTDLDVGPGSRVAVLLGNSPAFVAALYGVWRAGCVAVPLNTGFTAPEVRRVMEHCAATVLFVDEGTAPVGREVPRARLLAVADVLAGDGSGEAPAEAREEPNGRAVLAYTSGTTGRPKGVVLTHANLRANQEQLSGSRQHVLEGDVVLGALPLFHIYGLNVALAYPLARGATVLLVDRFEPASTLEAMVAHRVSVVPAVPPMYRAWAGVDGPLPDLSAVRLATSGAAPLDPALAEAFERRFGIGIWEGYGLTETGPVLTTTAMGDAPVPGSVGRPLPGVSLRLRDEAGRPVEAGEPGEVQAQGPNVSSGYWNDERATAAARTPDGWFRTGDVAYAREGNLFLVDRVDDLVIVNGFNVYPREVEEVLATHPGIGSAAVVGVADERSGQAVRAVVVASDPALTADDVVEHCRRSLARFKCPQGVEFVDELPALPTGKVLRRALRGEP
jgi:long-chain acyl-CoA synthetase